MAETTKQAEPTVGCERGLARRRYGVGPRPRRITAMRLALPVGDDDPRLTTVETLTLAGAAVGINLLPLWMGQMAPGERGQIQRAAVRREAC